jgi:hypothetical protein
MQRQDSWVTFINKISTVMKASAKDLYKPQNKEDDVSETMNLIDSRIDEELKPYLSVTENDFTSIQTMDLYKLSMLYAGSSNEESALLLSFDADDKKLTPVQQEEKFSQLVTSLGLADQYQRYLKLRNSASNPSFLNAEDLVRVCFTKDCKKRLGLEKLISIEEAIAYINERKDSLSQAKRAPDRPLSPAAAMSVLGIMPSSSVTAAKETHAEQPAPAASSTKTLS